MPLLKLKQEAKKAGLKPGSKRFDAYVFGTEHRIALAKAHKKLRLK